MPKNKGAENVFLVNLNYAIGIFITIMVISLIVVGILGGILGEYVLIFYMYIEPILLLVIFGYIWFKNNGLLPHDWSTNKKCQSGLNYILVGNFIAVSSLVIMAAIHLSSPGGGASGIPLAFALMIAFFPYTKGIEKIEQHRKYLKNKK